MNVLSKLRQGEGSRLLAMWACLALFLGRVIGQVEVLLIGPAWLPGMEYWYSGLLPYPVLLPVQIALLMFMAVLTWHQTVARIAAPKQKRKWKCAVRAFAVLYFMAMVARIGAQWLLGAADLLAAGGIPVAFHFVLALYLLLLARETQASSNHAGT